MRRHQVLRGLARFPHAGRSILAAPALRSAAFVISKRLSIIFSSIVGLLDLFGLSSIPLRVYLSPLTLHTCLDSGSKGSLEPCSPLLCLGQQPYVGLFGSVEIILCLKTNLCFFYAGYLCSCPLGLVMGYPSMGGSTGACYGDLASLNASGRGFLFLRA